MNREGALKKKPKRRQQKLWNKAWSGVGVKDMGNNNNNKKGGGSKKREKEEGKGEVWKYGDREREELKNENEE